MNADTKLHVAFGIFVLMWLSLFWEWLSPLRLPNMLYTAIVLPVAVADVVYLLYIYREPETWDDVRPLPTTGWPHDRDPTEQLTRPMADPYATRPYDPQEFILLAPAPYTFASCLPHPGPPGFCARRGVPGVHARP